MSDYKIIVDKINKAIALTSAVLTEEQIDSVQVLNEGGEWKLSFETLCDLLYEYELSISQQTYELLSEIGKIVEADRKEWEILRLQVSLSQ